MPARQAPGRGGRRRGAAEPARGHGRGHHAPGAGVTNERNQSSRHVGGNDDARRFLARAASGVLGVAAVATGVRGIAPADTSPPGARWKGKTDTNVKRWDVVTIGNLSRNRYWGEPDARGVRAVVCTCTLIQRRRFPAARRSVARRRRSRWRGSWTGGTGLKAARRYRRLRHPRARRPLRRPRPFHEMPAGWRRPGVAEILNKSGKLPRPVEAVTGRLFDAVDVRPHAGAHERPSLAAVRLRGGVRRRRPATRSRPATSSATAAGSTTPSISSSRRKRWTSFAAMADIIVPGHDNYFLVG